MGSSFAKSGHAASSFPLDKMTNSCACFQNRNEWLLWQPLVTKAIVAVTL